MNNYAMVHYPDGNPNPGMIFYQTAIFQVDIQNVFRYNYIIMSFKAIFQEQIIAETEYEWLQLRAFDLEV